ncbi:MAG: TolC family protein, partial [Spirochaetaceae bacterium]|nr:TolC family protein [Spirochaetaceae bacterium]
MKKIYMIICVFAFSLFQITGQSQFYSVDDLYNMALENSFSLAEKSAKQKAAGYRVKEARSNGAPKLSFESTLSYISNPDTLTVEAGSFGQIANPLDPPNPYILPADDTVFEMSGNTYYDFKLIVDQPVFTWGKIYNAYLAAKEGAAAAGIEPLKLKDQLKTEIKIYSLTLHHLKEIELAVSRQKEIAIRLERIAEDSYDNGMILQTEYLDAQTKRSEVELTENIITEQINQLVLNLTYITGVELTAVMIETENRTVPELQSWDEITNDAVQKNSDLSMLRHSIKAEEYKTKIQKGTYYFKPDLAFHMELSYSGSYFPFIQSGWNDKDKGNLTLTVGIKAPLADFGTMYASVKES